MYSNRDEGTFEMKMSFCMRIGVSYVLRVPFVES